MDKKEIRVKLKENGYTLINPSYSIIDGIIMFNAFDEFGDPYKFTIVPQSKYAVRVRFSSIVLHKEKDASIIFF